MIIKTVIRPKTEMKDSGIEWIGDIPANWRKSKLKYLGVYINGYAFKPSDWSARGRQIIRIQDLTGSNSGEPNYFNGTLDEKYRVVNGDILVSWAATLDAFIWTKEDGWLNQHIFKAVPNEKIVKGYFLWLLKIAMDNMNNDDKHGIVMQHVTIGLFNNYVVPLAPYTEQQAIANYLDETCFKIDEIIAEAKASIDEYKELKQSVIFEAVTKGLDKNVNVYKTGNSWIPSLPVGIKLSRFGLHHDIILGKMLCPNPRNEEDTLEPYYCAANVHFDGVTGVLKTMWFNSKEKETYVVHKNDMLIVEGGAGAGGAAIMNEEPPVSTFVQNSIMIVRSHMKDNRYSCYLVQALVKNKYVDVVCNKATIPHFTKEKVSYMPYPVFNRNERNEIANYLDERCKQIDSLIAEKESLIHDLEAYKKSLIYEVVTGKRRVV